ncbi:MAG: YafY family protein [Asticcacaulis sp.]
MTSHNRHAALLDALRAHDAPVSGRHLAAQLNVSLRTLYRDIAALQAEDAPIEGAPGIGYVLRPAYRLPPLMLSPDQIEALITGALWVADRAEPRLGEAAQSLIQSLSPHLPPAIRDDLNQRGLLTGRGVAVPETHIDSGLIRAAIRAERCVYMSYIDLKGAVSERTVWPIALGFFDHLRVLVVWCELRQAFRHFRTERILSWKPLDIPFPRKRSALLKAWRDTLRDGEVMMPEQSNRNMVTGFGSMSDETDA